MRAWRVTRRWWKRRLLISRLPRILWLSWWWWRHSCWRSSWHGCASSWLRHVWWNVVIRIWPGSLASGMISWRRPSVSCSAGGPFHSIMTVSRTSSGIITRIGLVTTSRSVRMTRMGRIWSRFRCPRGRWFLPNVKPRHALFNTGLRRTFTPFRGRECWIWIIPGGLVRWHGGMNRLFLSWEII